MGKQDLSRRRFLQTGALAGAGASLLNAAAQTVAPPQTPARGPLDEITVDELQAEMQSGRISSAGLVAQYLGRIEAIDAESAGEAGRGGMALKSVIEINPDAASIAASLDAERKMKGPRGPLHGVPVLIKDNIDTADRMQTTAGSLALLGSKPSRDSMVAQKLRSAGAVILGKTNLSEWANMRSSHSSSGWSGRGGQTRNPYALDRNPCGSSSGTAAGISANLAALGVGTETDGSIVCPSSANGLVGIKPTVGLISRAGIIPIAHSQDTAGPMARTVRDAAILLGALAGPDVRDTATVAASGKSSSDYTRFLDANGLRGARIGVARKYFGFSEAVDQLMENAIGLMKARGAAMVDPADLPSHGKFDDTELTVLLFELKADLNNYLAQRQGAPRSLADLIAFNQSHAAREMPFFGQDLFIKAEAKGGLISKEYTDALTANDRLSRDEGIDAVMNQHQLDAIVAPTGGPAWLIDLVDGDHDAGGSSNAAAVAGYPDITVPAGQVFGLPVGISFFGRAWSEPTLIKLAYAFEQAAKARKPPQFLPRAQL